jgi:hypothetical protein
VGSRCNRAEQNWKVGDCNHTAYDMNFEQRIFLYCGDRNQWKNEFKIETLILQNFLSLEPEKNVIIP